jgi:hypothetical protein
MKLRPILPALLLFLGGCFELQEFNGVPIISQYASKVIDYSSQYSSSYAANKALGIPDVYPNHGDLVNSWASYSPDDSREFIELGFDTVQTVIKIEIYETNLPGAIDTVYLRSVDSGKWKKIYSRPAETDLPAEARIKSIHLVETTELFDAIRIALNSPAVAGWNEIDAVALTGQRKE